jgi:hypothetical protein
VNNPQIAKDGVIIGKYVGNSGSLKVFIVDSLTEPGNTAQIMVDMNKWKAYDLVKDVGRELIGVLELGAKRQLPHDIEGEIASHLTGIKKKSLKGQLDVLKNEVGIEGPPRAGGRKITVRSKKDAKKSCYPGYEVYNYRKTQKGIFYDCAPKRKTRRNRK